jgi:hypothetical protein
MRYTDDESRNWKHATIAMAIGNFGEIIQMRAPVKTNATGHRSHRMQEPTAEESSEAAVWVWASRGMVRKKR